MPRHRNKITPMTYPIGVEYGYRRDLLWLTNQYKLTLKRVMSPEVVGLAQEVLDHLVLPTGHSMRRDAWQDDMRRIMARIAREMTTPVNTTIKRMVARGPQVNEYNKREWRRLIKSQYGIDPTKEQPDRWNALLKNWSRNNSLLIKDIPAKTSLQISEQVTEALRHGQSNKSLAKDIFRIMSERTDVSDSRAELIARDQVAKLNGSFTRERQEDIGVNSYIWRTVGDERVRDSHADVDGETFSWDQPPLETDGNHPGEDIQCRCWAEPILPEVVDLSVELLDEAA